MDNPQHVWSDIKSIWPLQAASDGPRWQKSDEKTLAPKFHLSFWPSGAPFPESIGIKTFNGQLQHVWSGITSIWPLFTASDGPRQQKSNENWNCLPFGTLFSHSIAIKTYPELFQTCFQWCKVYLASVGQVRWPQMAKKR